MAMVEINWNPTAKQLRQFGLISMVLLPFAGWLWSQNLLVTSVMLGVGVVLAAMAWIAPRVLRTIYIGLTILTAPIAWIVTEVTLLIVFFGAVLPIGLCLRLAGRDLLQHKRDPQAATYWMARKKPRDVESYYQQF